MRCLKSRYGKLRVFSTVREVESQLYKEQNPEWVHSNECPTESQMSANSGWYGGFTKPEEAFNAYVGGWYDPKMLGRVKMPRNLDTGSRRKMRNVFNIQGSYPDIARFMTGLPDCMVDEVFMPVKHKVVHIIYSPTAHAGVSSDTLMKALENIVKLVLTLEMNGYRVQLDTFCYHYHNGSRGTFGTLYPVKAPDRALNLKRMMFAMGHTAMMRVIDFTSTCKDPESWYIESMGHAEWDKGKELVRDLMDTRSTVLMNFEEAQSEYDMQEILSRFDIKEA